MKTILKTLETIQAWIQDKVHCLQKPVAKTILIVSEDARHQQLIQVNLLRMGYNVLQALTENDPLTQVQTHWPDLIVLDMTLPNGEADELLPILKEAGYGRTLPLIALLKEQDNGEEDIDGGWIRWNGDKQVSAGLRKPIYIPRLMSYVKNFLSDKPGYVEIYFG